MKISNIVEGKYDPVDFFKDEDPVVKIVLEKGKILSDFIKKNCAPWLKAAGGPSNMVYRGFVDVGSSKLAFDVRLYRKVVLPMLQGKQPKLSSALAKQILTGEEDYW